MGTQRQWLNAGVAVIGVLVNGCATMFVGTTQNVGLDVQPAGAQVTMYRWDGTVVAGPVTSPGKAEVQRPQEGQSYIVVASRDGYCPRYWVTPRRVNGGYVASGVLGALLGAGVGAGIATYVDATNGAAFSIEPDPVRASLAEGQACRE
jgi:hypothetical protein